MRRWFVTLMLLLAPAVVSAQQDLVGRHIRAKLAGPEGPWVVGVVSEAHSDSLTILLQGGTAIRLRRADVTVQVADGRHRGRGFALGTLVGGVASLALLSEAWLHDRGDEALMALIMVTPMGAALGAAIGFGSAAPRWRSVSTGTKPCGGFRRLDSGAPSAPIAARAPRNRRHGAIIGAVLLGGIGLVGVSADSKMPSGARPGMVLGSALLGALVGSGVGPREKVVIQVTCP